MAAEFRHKRYFKFQGGDSSITGAITFSSVADAKTKIGFTSVWDTSSPTKTEALEDSDSTLVVTYEFNNADEQTAFKAAVDGAWGDSTSPYSGEDIDAKSGVEGTWVEHVKTEWLNADGSVSTTDDIVRKK